MKSFVFVVFNVNGVNTGFYNSGVRARPEKQYIFETYDVLMPGDTVVVDTCNGFQLATVTELVEEFPNDIPVGTVGRLKEVVCKVDFSKFFDRKEKREKAKSIKAKMDKKVKEIQSQAIYEMLAEKDPTLKTLLDEYKELINE